MIISKRKNLVNGWKRLVPNVMIDYSRIEVPKIEAIFY